MTVAERRAILPAELFLVATNQMFGAGSQMLRTRASDALALTRRAIEAAATAYRLWKNPKLADTYVNAYPNHDKIGEPDQWKRTKAAGSEFSTSKLFDQPGDVFAGLKALYGLTSAMSSHAGMGALAGHRDGNYQRVAPFLGGDVRKITNHWYTLLAIYMEILKIFVRMLRTNAPEEAMSILAHDFLAWRDRTAALLESRAPWARATAESFRRRKAGFP